MYSDIATYRANGEPVFDVWFAAVEAEGEVSLYAFKSPSDRESGLPGFERAGYCASTASHHDAYIMIRGGTRAYYHNGDVPCEQVWTPLSLNNPVAIAA